MQRTGRVISAENGEIEVSFERPEACAHCGACAGQKEETRVKIPGDAPVGRWVDVEMPDTQVLRASALAYAVPILMLLLGLALGQVLSLGDVMTAVCGVALIGCSWFVLRFTEKRVKQSSQWQPKVLAIHEEGWDAPTSCGK